LSPKLAFNFVGDAKTNLQKGKLQGKKIFIGQTKMPDSKPKADNNPTNVIKHATPNSK
jgi:hypothetical protein